MSTNNGTPLHAPRPPIPPQTARSQQRIDAIDILRGIALIGMLTVHGLVLFNDDGTPTLVTQIASGRSFAIFALLAGVSLALMTGANKPVTGAKLNQSTAGILARAVYIATIGTIAGYLTIATKAEFSVILVHYGLLFIIALPFLRLSSRVLIAVAISGAVAAPVAIYLLRPHLQSTSSAQATLADLFTHPIQFLSEMLVVGTYPLFALFVLAISGLVIGRLDLRSRAVAIRLAIIGTAMAATSWIAASILLLYFGGLEALHSAANELDITPTTILWSPQETSATPWELAQRIGHSHSTFDLVHSIGIATALLGILLLITRHRIVAQLLQPLAAAGSMPLTIYSTQVFLIGEWSFEIYPYSMYILGIVVALLVFATLWRRARGRGPLELGALWCARKASNAYRAYTTKHSA